MYVSFGQGSSLVSTHMLRPFYLGGCALPGPRLELNLEPTAHSARHAVLHMAPKWSSHRTTRAGHTIVIKCDENTDHIQSYKTFAFRLKKSNTYYVHS